MKKLKIDKKEILLFTVLFIFAICICFNFIIGYNCYDTYKMAEIGYTSYAKTLFLADGRPISSLYILIANFFRIPVEILYKISIVSGIALSIMMLMHFKKIIEVNSLNSKEKSHTNFQKVLLIILLFCMFFNFTYIDDMIFIEFPIMVFSIWFYILAANESICYKKYVKSTIFLTIAVFCYQATINVYFIMCAFFICLKDKKIDKNSILHFLKCIFLSVIPVVLNYIYIKGYSYFSNLSTNRLPTDYATIIKNIISFFLGYSKVIVNSINVLPKYFFTLCMISISLVLFYYFIKDREKYVDIYVKVILLFLIAILSCIPIGLVFPIMLIDTSGRLFWALGACLSLAYLLIYCCTELLTEEKNKLLLIIICIYFIFQNVGIYQCQFKYKQINNIDKEICDEIENKIASYEVENNLKVEIGYYRYVISSDEVAYNEKYKNLPIRQSYIMRALPLKPFFKFYENRNIELNYLGDEDFNNLLLETPKENTIEQEKSNWNLLKENLLITFRGNEVYIAIYI